MAKKVSTHIQKWLGEMFKQFQRFAVSGISGGSRKILGRIRNFTASISRIPSWLKSRPAAIKSFIREDRKKKKYRSFRLQKRISPEPRYIPPTGTLLKASFTFLWAHKKVFFYIIMIHAILYVTVIRSPVTTNISSIQNSVNSVFGGESQKTTKGVIATLGSVLSISGSSNQSRATLITISILLMSLVYIWAIRELHTKIEIRARDAYYRGLSPLISSSILLIIASLQLIPFAAMAFVYSTARTGSLFASGFEDLAVFIIMALTGILSLYFITSTIIGLYVVTLPGMYPLQALRSAKKLVQFQRFKVFKRIFFLPIILGLGYLALIAIVIRFATSQVFFVVELLQLLILPLIHIYLYKLYRSLI